MMTNVPEISGYVSEQVSAHARAPEGHLVGFFDSETGEIVDRRPIFEDFGDLAPFFVLTQNEDVAKQEFAAVHRHLERDLWHVNSRRRNRFMVATYDWTDLLLGLLDYYDLTKDGRAIEICDRLFEQWYTKLFHGSFAYGRAVKTGGPVFALPVSTVLDVGMFPELLLHRATYADVGAQRDYVADAERLVLGWLQDPIVKSTGLFPNILQDGLGRIVRRTHPNRVNCVTLFKHNTNALASMLSVWMQTKNPEILRAIDAWIVGCERHLMTDDGFVCMRWQPDKGIVQGPTDHNFQVIDLMCDIVHETGKQQFLDLAVRIANAWIGRRGKTGLIPHELSGKRSRRSMSDSQTDFSVALVKLSVLTGEKHYLTVAQEVMDSVQTYMYRPRGMANWVDVDDGTVIDSTCKTKFFVLSLKGWLALANAELVYTDPRFTALLSDR